MSAGKKLFCALGDLFLIVLPVLALLFLLTTTFGLSVGRGLTFWALCFCCLWWAFWELTRRWYVTLPLLAVAMAVLLWRWLELLLSGMSSFLASVFDSYNNVFPTLNLYYPGLASGDCTLFLCVAAFVLAFLLSMAVTAHRGRVLYSLMATIPVFSLCVAVNSWPNIYCVMALMLFWGLSLACGCFGGPANPNSAKAARVMLIPLALFLLAALYFVKPAEYEYDSSNRELSQRIDEAGERIMRLLGKEPTVAQTPSPAPTAQSQQDEDDAARRDSVSGSTPTPGLNGSTGTGWGASSLWSMGTGSLDVASQGALRQTGAVILRARASTGGLVYLRSYSMGGYTGTGWSAAPKYMGDSSLGFAASAVAGLPGAEAASIEIERAGDLSSVLHSPYYCADSGQSDAYLEGDFGDYSLSYIAWNGDITKAALDGESAAAELSYRQYAHAEYTSIPASTKTALLALASEAGISPGSSGLISEVAAFVKASASYDLSVSSMPAGEDCAVYFLTVSRRGYCIHFATAAAAMYRALGVPARLVSGFMFTAQAGEWTPTPGWRCILTALAGCLWRPPAPPLPHRRPQRPGPALWIFPSASPRKRPRHRQSGPRRLFCVPF